MNKVFCPFLMDLPQVATGYSVEVVVEKILLAYGTSAESAFFPDNQIPSPLAGHRNTQWIRRANCVGINVRTIGSFWNIIPYAFTLPAAQQAIHILPIWEPGVVASLYGMSSWNINPEFFSPELERAFPHLDTVEKQLKVVVNLLHLTGRVVGMDVVPHTDRYAEQVLANPSLFEWLERRDTEIVRHQRGLFREVEELIYEALGQMGSADVSRPVPAGANILFDEMSEAERLLILFGPPEAAQLRLDRRKMFIQWLFEHGLETVPATMGPPYRGIEVDSSPEAAEYDEAGRLWRDYRITRPEPMSRVFGPLTRYRLYETVNDQSWELDFKAPAVRAWQYAVEHYKAVQREYNFDFMRGDMSHVQMRPDGVPARPDAWYDLLAAVKKGVLEEKPYFGYFAESFLALPGEMAFGSEEDHLEASLADSTLGDLQSEPVHTERFMQELSRYVHLLHTRQFAPNFTILTADKDDPRFDRFYLSGNEARYFTALFLPEMPSYMALGFETRDPHPTPAPNEHYTKLYVFQTGTGPKATRGPYQWGQNNALYERLCRQKRMAEHIYTEISEARVTWIWPPDADGKRKYVAWAAGKYIFMVNFDTTAEIQTESLEEQHKKLIPVFSTHLQDIPFSGKQSFVLQAGEGLILGIEE